MSTRILIADDSADILFLYRAVLESVPDWEIQTASTGKEAFELARSWRPDLVLTDLMMPEMTGLDLITQIRSDLVPPLPRMVAISGFPDLEAEALNRGAARFHLKPLLPADLLAIVHQLLGDRIVVDGVTERTAAERLSVRQRAEVAVAEALARQPDLPQRLPLIARLTSGYFGHVTVVVILVRDGELRIGASAGGITLQTGTPVRDVLGLTAHVIESGSRFVVTDLSTLPMLRVSSGSPLRFLAIVPVFGPANVVVGGIALMDTVPARFDATDLTLIEHVARWGAIAVSTEARRVMLTDSGLFQPGSWRTWLAEEMTHVREGAILGVSLLEPVNPRPLTFEEGSALWQQAPRRTAIAELEHGVIAAYIVAPDQDSAEQQLEELYRATSARIAPRAGSIVTFVDAQLPNEPESALKIAGDALKRARASIEGKAVHTVRGVVR